jgi:glyceraldehyde 3-phosphate dehydrogenase
MESSAVGYEKELQSYIDNEKAAVKLANYVGELLYTKGVELVLFRNHLLDITTSEIINLHDYAEKVVGKKIFITTTAHLAETLFGMELSPAKIDIGRLAHEWIQEGDKFANKTDFLKNKLGGLVDNRDFNIEPRDVILYGFGRIGRLAARELIKQAGKGQQLRLKAIVTRSSNAEEITKRAALLSQDSVHGAFKGTVKVDTENNALVLNGQTVHMIAASNPEDIDYTKVWNQKCSRN